MSNRKKIVSRKNCQEALIEVSSRLKASDYGQKEKELQALKDKIVLLAGNSRQWRSIVRRTMCLGRG